MQNIKTFLKQPFIIDKEIDKLNESLQILRNRISSPSGGNAGGLGVQQSRNLSLSQDLVARLLDAEAELKQAKAELLEIEMHIYKISLNLPPAQRSVITLRYICRHQWADVALIADISEMQAMRLHKASLKTLNEQELS